MILKRPVFIESVAVAMARIPPPTLREGSLRPLSLRPNTPETPPPAFPNTLAAIARVAEIDERVAPIVAVLEQIEPAIEAVEAPIERVAPPAHSAPPRIAELKRELRADPFPKGL